MPFHITGHEIRQHGHLRSLPRLLETTGHSHLERLHRTKVRSLQYIKLRRNSPHLEEHLMGICAGGGNVASRC